MNTKADRILINDLLVRCVIGEREEERRDRQDVVINISLHADLSKAGKSDRLDDTIDYRELKKRIVRMAEGSGFQLVEKLAEEAARICLEDPRAQEVQVRVEKPLSLRFARSAGVEITRRRGQ